MRMVFLYQQFLEKSATPDEPVDSQLVDLLPIKKGNRWEKVNVCISKGVALIGRADGLA